MCQLKKIEGIILYKIARNLNIGGFVGWDKVLEMLR